MRLFKKDLEGVNGSNNYVLVLIDEAHRLTKSYHTILDIMSREIRDKGMHWISTQNLIDILPEMRANFGIPRCSSWSLGLNENMIVSLSLNMDIRCVVR